MRLQRSRRSSADIDRIRSSASHPLSQRPDLLHQGVQIQIHLVFPRVQRGGAEGTVGAYAGTERDPHIQAESLLAVQLREQLMLPKRRFIGQHSLFLTYEILFLEGTDDLFPVHPCLNLLHDQLGRTYAGKHSPRQLPACPFRQITVQPAGHFPFLICILLQFSGHQHEVIPV